MVLPQTMLHDMNLWLLVFPHLVMATGALATGGPSDLTGLPMGTTGAYHNFSTSYLASCSFQLITFSFAVNI